MARLLTLLVAAAATAVHAYPQHAQVRQASTQPYQAPGADDSRGPCPMLNTLANHGYINHNGRDLERQDVFDALLNFVGIEESAVDLAFTNALILCNFTTGADCGTTLKNLTILALPHAFEHDHSFSRQDYNLAADGTYDNNANFDADIFQTSLDVLDGSDHMTFQQMQQVRLQRESLALQTDVSGWFIEQKPIQNFESGFIFSVMGDFNLTDYLNETQVYVPWWQYWFTNEALPYELGWHPPNPPKNSSYILSVSSRVLAAPVTSTPSPLPSGAFDDSPPPATLPAQVNPTTTYELPTQSPYVGPIANSASGQLKRQVSATAAPSSTVTTFKNPYVETLSMEDILIQQAYAMSKVTASASASVAASTTASTTTTTA